jgi:MYXO-CTERM domain-containing protein
MNKNFGLGVIASASIAACALAQPAGTVYFGSTWGNPSNSVVYLDANMNFLGSFPTNGQLPNGVAVGGGLVYTGHFVNADIEAYDFNGNFQFSFPAGSGTQGLEYVNGNIAVFDNGSINYYNALNGAPAGSIPAQEGGGIEGLAYDGGNNLFQLGDVIYATDPANGNLNYTIPNPAVNDPFNGTGLSYGGGILTVAAANGNWYQIDPTNGNVLASGNNGLDMYGLGQAVPTPGAMALLGVAGLAVTRRRR